MRVNVRCETCIKRQIVNNRYEENEEEVGGRDNDGVEEGGDEK